ncbi:MAG: hypothetical protein RL336_10 [Pseudomonadota bacterium]|jgi:phosphodiesterase/alkaline phosphatase D-like protein
MLTRRQFLGATSVGVLASGSWAALAAKAIDDPAVTAIFAHGVASGEPTAESVLLWSRISTDRPVVKVSWAVATDMAMKNIVQEGVVTTDQKQDYCVKVEVPGLSSGSTYYYQFNFAGTYSEIGRTKTLAEGDLSELKIAVVSCSNLPFGFFNAYEDIAKRSDIDVVLHLGDYLYEYGPDGYGGAVGARIGRNHEPPRETITLADYRIRHGQYKADRASRLMHAAHPLIAIWDDHESANNPYKEGAQNHQPESEGSWHDRREASLQAYFEWMPVNDPKHSEDRMRMWRRFEFGSLASLVTLETRHTGRDEQVDYAKYLPELTDAEKAQHFKDTVLWDERRNMLSEDMEAFYKAAIASRKTHWQLVANQIPMARTHVPPLSDIIHPAVPEDNDPLAAERNALQVLSRFNLPIYTDTWDGYPAARERFYAMNKSLGCQDLVVLTGDSHSFWLNRLFDKTGEPMGVEIGTTGVTSPGDFIYFNEQIAHEMDNRLASHNDEILWTDGINKGYTLLTINRQAIDIDYIVVSTILSEDYSVNTIKKTRLIKEGQTLKIS